MKVSQDRSGASAFSQRLGYDGSMRVRLVVALAALSLGVVACNGGGSGTNPPAPPCKVPVKYQVLYPIPGATGVPDAPQQIVFALGGALNTTSNAAWNVILGPDTNGNNALNNGISLGALQTITAQQIPSPSAVPTIANPVFQSSVVGLTFNSKTNVFIFLNNLASGCSPVYTGASFVTQ
jgi:hypothetical protein